MRTVYYTGSHHMQSSNDMYLSASKAPPPSKDEIAKLRLVVKDVVDAEKSGRLRTFTRGGGERYFINY